MKQKTFSARTYKDAVRFNMPKDVRKDLGLKGSRPGKPGDTVNLLVVSSTGRYNGPLPLMSGTEIYGRGLGKSKILKDQEITVTARRLVTTRGAH